MSDDPVIKALGGPKTSQSLSKKNPHPERLSAGLSNGTVLLPLADHPRRCHAVALRHVDVHEDGPEVVRGVAAGSRGPLSVDGRHAIREIPYLSPRAIGEQPSVSGRGW